MNRDVVISILNHSESELFDALEKATSTWNYLEKFIKKDLSFIATPHDYFSTFTKVELVFFLDSINAVDAIHNYLSEKGTIKKKF